MSNGASDGGYHPSDVRALDRWAAALLMPIGPAAVAVIRYVIPPAPVGESVAANPDAQRLVLALGVVAILTLLPGAFAAVRLVRLYAPILSVWTAAFLIPGYLGMTALLATDAVAMAGTDLDLDPARVTTLNTAVLALPSVDILLSIFIVGHIVGVVLLGIAAYRTRLMPRLAALLLTVSQPLHLAAVLLGSPWLDLLAWGLTTLGMAYLARYLVRLPDDEWELRPAARRSNNPINAPRRAHHLLRTIPGLNHGHERITPSGETR